MNILSFNHINIFLFVINAFVLKLIQATNTKNDGAEQEDYVPCINIEEESNTCKSVFNTKVIDSNTTLVDDYINTKINNSIISNININISRIETKCPLLYHKMYEFYRGLVCTEIYSNKEINRCNNINNSKKQEICSGYCYGLVEELQKYYIQQQECVNIIKDSSEFFKLINENKCKSDTLFYQSNSNKCLDLNSNLNTQVNQRNHNNQRFNSHNKNLDRDNEFSIKDIYKSQDEKMYWALGSLLSILLLTIICLSIYLYIKNKNNKRKQNGNTGSNHNHDNEKNNIIIPQNNANYAKLKENNTDISIVVCPFFARRDDELYLSKFDRIKICKIYNDKWAYGQNLTTKSNGFFPLICTSNNSLSDNLNNKVCPSSLSSTNNNLKSSFNSNSNENIIKTIIPTRIQSFNKSVPGSVISMQSRRKSNASCSLSYKSSSQSTIINNNINNSSYSYPIIKITSNSSSTNNPNINLNTDPNPNSDYVHNYNPKMIKHSKSLLAHPMSAIQNKNNSNLKTNSFRLPEIESLDKIDLVKIISNNQGDE